MRPSEVKRMLESFTLNGMPPAAPWIEELTMSHEGFPSSVRIIDLRGVTAIIIHDHGSVHVSAEGIGVSAQIDIDPDMKFERVEVAEQKRGAYSERKR